MTENEVYENIGGWVVTTKNTGLLYEGWYAKILGVRCDNQFKALKGECLVVLEQPYGPLKAPFYNMKETIVLYKTSKNGEHKQKDTYIYNVYNIDIKLTDIHDLHIGDNIYDSVISDSKPSRVIMTTIKDVITTSKLNELSTLISISNISNMSVEYHPQNPVLEYDEEFISTKKENRHYYITSITETIVKVKNSDVEELNLDFGDV